MPVLSGKVSSCLPSACRNEKLLHPRLRRYSKMNVGTVPGRAPAPRFSNRCALFSFSSVNCSKFELSGGQFISVEVKHAPGAPYSRASRRRSEGGERGGKETLATASAGTCNSLQVLSLNLARWSETRFVDRFSVRPSRLNQDTYIGLLRSK